MDRDQAKAIIENILFIAGDSVPTAMFVSLFKGEYTAEEMESIIHELADDYAERGLKISEVAGGWRLQTRPEYALWITSFYKMDKGHKLSRASLETLAIIAYRQPVTRAEIDEIRGVDSGGVLRGLVDKTLVKTMGRRKAPGRPLMYGTTNRFLEYFGLARLADLPTLDEFPMDGDGTPRQATMVFPAPDNGEDDQGDEPDDQTVEQTQIACPVADDGENNESDEPDDQTVEQTQIACPAPDNGENNESDEPDDQTVEQPDE